MINNYEIKINSKIGKKGAQKNNNYKISKTAQNNYLGKEFMNYTIKKICEVLPQYEEEFKKYIEP